jgi:hypothetical protein
MSVLPSAFPLPKKKILRLGLVEAPARFFPALPPRLAARTFFRFAPFRAAFFRAVKVAPPVSP